MCAIRARDASRRYCMSPSPPIFRRLRLAGEIFRFLGARKKWWLFPIVGILIVLALFVFIFETGVGPMIYALF